MRLTDEEQALLSGRAGQAAQKSMQILVALGRIYGAEDMVEVSSVQVSGVSYHNLGDAGLEWLETMAKDGQARALATLNPAGMDLERWQELGVPESFARRQLRVVAAYREMGIAPLCTCTPYLVGNLPLPREHLAWSESSAVAFANTVLAARTNREGGPSALAAALVGRTPRYGLHLEQNRRPTIEVVVDADVSGAAAHGAFGLALARATDGRVPLVRGLGQPDVAELKALCAAVVTFGGSPQVHISGVTPEADLQPVPSESTRITSHDLAEASSYLNDRGSDRVDMVCLGCPHASIAELKQIASLLAGRTVSLDTWICTARPTATAARGLDLIEAIEASGAKVVCDTCFVVAPLERRGATVATNSAKGCFYGRGHNGLKMRHGSLQRCIDAAVTGRWA